MNRFIETIANSYFPELLQPPVILELEKSGNYRHQVQSLSRQCIRDIIRSKIEPNSTNFVRFKLLFQEELNILKTSQLIRDNDFFEKPYGYAQWLSEFGPREFNQKFMVPLKYDSRIMRQVLEQNLDSEKHDSVTIVILEKSFRVVLGEDVIMEDPHFCYNTEPAMVFTRMCFEKNIRMIQLEVEMKYSEKQAEQTLSSFINKIGLVAPEDKRWESACRHKGNFIYRHNTSFTKGTRERYSFLSQLFVMSSSEPEKLDNQRIFYSSNDE